MACQLLKHRVKHSVYDMRYRLGLTTKRKKSEKTDLRSVQKTEVKKTGDKIKFDVLDYEQSDLMLGVLEHSIRKNRPLSIAEIVKTFHISVSEARALMYDVFQQASKIMVHLKQRKKMRLVNPRDDASLEFY